MPENIPHTLRTMAVQVEAVEASPPPGLPIEHFAPPCLQVLSATIAAEPVAEWLEFHKPDVARTFRERMGELHRLADEASFEKEGHDLGDAQIMLALRLMETSDYLNRLADMLDPAGRSKAMIADHDLSIPCPKLNPSDELPSGLPPLARERRILIADAVADLIRRYEARDHVRVMVQRWEAIHGRWADQAHEWRERRRQHEERVAGDPTLQNQNAGPPGWVFETWPSGKRMLSGWVPPELAADEQLSPRWPLPVPEGEVRLEGKYAGLAAIHDHDSRGNAKIGRADVALAYRQLVMQVESLTADDERPLWGWLKDLEMDLRALRQADFPPFIEVPEQQQPDIEQTLAEYGEKLTRSIQSAIRPAEREEDRPGKRSARGSTAAAERVSTARDRKILKRRTQAWALHRQGLTNSQIALRLQVDESTISRDLKQPDPSSDPD